MNPTTPQQPTGLLLDKQEIAPKVHRYLFRAPDIARRRPGQFVIVRLGEGGERVPLTIADADSERMHFTQTVVNGIESFTDELERFVEVFFHG